MKFAVTPELARLIKTLRAQNGVGAKELAEHLGKSPSYVSKLEGGAVKFVERGTLADALCFAAGGGGLYEEALPSAVRLLRGSMEPGRLVDQVWLMHFDVVERPIRVPEGMAADMARNLAEMGVTTEGLAAFLNANVDSQMSDSFPANEMLVVDYDGKRRMLARVEIEESAIDQLIRERGATVRYFTLYNVVHALFRLKRFPDVMEKLPPDDAATVLRCAAAYMERWGVHSLIGYSHFLSSDEFIEHQRPLAAAEVGIVERIGERLREVSAHDPLHAVSQLNAFYDTLEWDPAFALKVMGMPFAVLDDLSFSNKRRLLDDIRELVERYDRMEEFERKIESY
ncbi:helix-turn-helix domain-containing protein [Arabiibacter massiliensis]|uniref:helix-turn-helix domain-containing protein n=1 Tax=Arabiibacter massiliensis TaxID=1870985 RepID=UPI0009BA64C8|nr:helix-turn-helix transcriptional regulator [Arabiibacter massiliensis]